MGADIVIYTVMTYCTYHVFLRMKLERENLSVKTIKMQNQMNLMLIIQVIIFLKFEYMYYRFFISYKSPKILLL